MGMTNFDSVTALGGFTGPTNFQGTVLTAITTGVADVVLTPAQAQNTRLEVTTGHATNAIVVPVALPGKIYIVVNADGTNAVLIKVAGGTAVTVALSKTALVQVNSAGTQVTRLTADV
jgi:hypothetical protein